MTVLPFRSPSRGRPGPVQGSAEGDPRRLRVPVSGTFTTPDLLTGVMDGWVRVLHCSIQGSGLRCLGVISGALYDAKGRRIGLASTRCHLPVRTMPDTAPPADPPGSFSGTLLVGPLDISLLGFQVHINATDLSRTSLLDRLPETAGGGPHWRGRQR